MLKVRGGPKFEESVAPRKSYDKSYYCGPSMACTKDELNDYEAAMGLPISTAAELAPHNDTAHGFGYSPDTV